MQWDIDILFAITWWCFLLFCDGNDPIYITQSCTSLKLKLNHSYIFLIFQKSWKGKKALYILFREITFYSSFLYIFFWKWCIKCCSFKNLRSRSFLSCMQWPYCELGTAVQLKRGKGKVVVFDIFGFNSQLYILAVHGFSSKLSALLMPKPDLQNCFITSSWSKPFSYSLCLCPFY